jgi:hypothetical protein
MRWGDSKSAWNSCYFTRRGLFHAVEFERKGHVSTGGPRASWVGWRCQAHAARRRHGGRRQSRRLAQLASPTGFRFSLFGA